MFKDDIDLVHEMIGKYGFRAPLVDLGGLHARELTVADYSITIKTGDQHARYLHLDRDPFSDIENNYKVCNPQYGDPFIEDLPERDYWGTAVCLSVLEHVKNPFEVFHSIWRVLKHGGLLILSTEFSFPFHPSPEDNFRFSPTGLKILAECSGFKVLENGWRLDINADMGVKEIHTGVSQEIRSVYIVCQK
jgi:SAM-dependent methyltransferase